MSAEQGSSFLCHLEGMPPPGMRFRAAPEARAHQVPRGPAPWTHHSLLLRVPLGPRQSPRHPRQPEGGRRRGKSTGPPSGGTGPKLTLPDDHAAPRGWTEAEEVPLTLDIHVRD